MNHIVEHIRQIAVAEETSRRHSPSVHEVEDIIVFRLAVAVREIYIRSLCDFLIVSVVAALVMLSYDCAFLRALCEI